MRRIPEWSTRRPSRRDDTGAPAVEHDSKGGVRARANTSDQPNLNRQFVRVGTSPTWRLLAHVDCFRIVILELKCGQSLIFVTLLRSRTAMLEDVSGTAIDAVFIARHRDSGSPRNGAR